MIPALSREAFSEQSRAALAAGPAQLRVNRTLIIESPLTHCLRLCSDGAVKRLRDKIGSVRHRLFHAGVPLPRFLGA